MFKKMIIGLLIIQTQYSFTATKSICEFNDDRVLSQDDKIGRSSKMDEVAKGCTVTMISEDCAISAGHCHVVFDKVSFNVPLSIDSVPQKADEKDIYLINQESIVFKNDGVGADWAVFKLMPNHITGKKAGDAQGFYNINLEDTPQIGDSVSITGFGSDKNDGEQSHYAQQTNSAILSDINGTVLKHVIDTTGGNSGSAIINTATQEIIGIHTHGGCTWGGANHGTVISAVPELKEAIKTCLNTK